MTQPTRSCFTISGLASARAGAISSCVAISASKVNTLHLPRQGNMPDAVSCLHTYIGPNTLCSFSVSAIHDPPDQEHLPSIKHISLHSSLNPLSLPFLTVSQFPQLPAPFIQLISIVNIIRCSSNYGQNQEHSKVSYMDSLDD